MSTPNPKNVLVGNCFHSILDEKIHWQGEIIGTPEPGWYLVQLFSWLDGRPTNRCLVRFEDMKDWLFYADAESMKWEYTNGTARHLRSDLEKRA